MKNLMFIFIIFLYQNGFSQRFIPTDSIYNSLYYQVVYDHIEYLKKNNPIVSEQESVNILYTKGITDSFPSEINGLDINIFEENNLKNIGKKGIQLLRIFPIIIYSNKIYVRIGDYHVIKKGKKLLFTNNGGSSYNVFYNCELEEFVLEIESQGGI